MTKKRIARTTPGRGRTITSWRAWWTPPLREGDATSGVRRGRAVVRRTRWAARARMCAGADFGCVICASSRTSSAGDRMRRGTSECTVRARSSRFTTLFRGPFSVVTTKKISVRETRGRRHRRERHPRVRGRVPAARWSACWRMARWRRSVSHDEDERAVLAVARDIVTVILEQRHLLVAAFVSDGTAEAFSSAEFDLVDLAGSERTQERARRDDDVKESININSTACSPWAT